MIERKGVCTKHQTAILRDSCQRLPHCHIVPFFYLKILQISVHRRYHRHAILCLLTGNSIISSLCVFIIQTCLFKIFSRNNLISYQLLHTLIFFPGCFVCIFGTGSYIPFRQGTGSQAQDRLPFLYRSTVNK